jgi:hypothetical protein
MVTKLELAAFVQHGGYRQRLLFVGRTRGGWPALTQLRGFDSGFGIIAFCCVRKRWDATVRTVRIVRVHAEIQAGQRLRDSIWV